MNQSTQEEMDLVKAGCQVHHAAIGDLPGNGVCSEAQLTAINAAIGRMIASAPESKTMDVYNSVSALVDKRVPAYLMSKVNEEDAKAAYAALIEFTKVVKANPIKPTTSPTMVSSESASSISAAADKLASSAYPFMKGIDWTDDNWGRSVPGKSAQETLKAVNSMIAMGSKMDSAALQEAAMAHVKAIEGMDSKGVMTQDDFKAILAGIGKTVASVPRSSVMDVYHEVGKLVGGPLSGIPQYLYLQKNTNPADALAAYDSFLDFKDTVRSCQPDKKIGDAAAKLSKATYPFMKQVNWNDNLYWTVPGADPISWAKAIGKIIDHGASMDMDLVKAGCHAHHDAIQGLPDDLMCSEAQLTNIYASIGCMIASAPESKTMDVYNSVSALVDEKVPAYLMSKVNEKDAKAAYAALLEFTEVVKANPITPSTYQTKVSSETASSVNAAADKLASAAYPFMKGIDWTDELYGKTVPGKTAKETLKAVDSMIMMGAKMDSAALQEAAKAHVKAIEGMDSKGVMTLEDFKAILAGIGKTVASVPEAVVMRVYTEMSKLVGKSTSAVPQFVLSKQNPSDAMAAYSAFMEFKDTVKTGQPGYASNGSGLALLLLAALVSFIAFLLKSLPGF